MAEEILKRCCTCRQQKCVSQFGVDRNTKDLLKKRCKACHNADNARYRKENPETSRASCLNWQRANPDKVRAKRERFLASKPVGWEAERQRAYVQRNPEAVIATRKASKEKNKIHYSVSSRLRGWLNGRKPSKTKTFEILGYTQAELRAHLEKQFQPGMSWQNYGEWHVDHIQPLSYFKVESIHDPVIRYAWALSNLRPLWAKENRQKSAKLLYLI